MTTPVSLKERGDGDVKQLAVALTSELRALVPWL